MKRLPENMAARMVVQRTTVDARRRRKTCVLESDGVALAGSDMGAKINRRNVKSQRRFGRRSNLNRHLNLNLLWPGIMIKMTIKIRKLPEKVDFRKEKRPDTTPASIRTSAPKTFDAHRSLSFAHSQLHFRVQQRNQINRSRRLGLSPVVVTRVEKNCYQPVN